MCFNDLIIDFQGLLKSGILAGIAREKRNLFCACFSGIKPYFLNEKISFPITPVHAVERILFCNISGMPGPTPEFLFLVDFIIGLGIKDFA